jgi:hypothetical protein
MLQGGCHSVIYIYGKTSVMAFEGLQFMPHTLIVPFWEWVVRIKDYTCKISGLHFKFLYISLLFKACTHIFVTLRRLGLLFKLRPIFFFQFYTGFSITSASYDWRKHGSRNRRKKKKGKGKGKGNKVRR